MLLNSKNFLIFNKIINFYKIIFNILIIYKVDKGHFSFLKKLLSSEQLL